MNWTREQLAEMLGLSSRHLQYIETKGQHPSLNKFYMIATLLNISVDQFFFQDNKSKTTRRRQVDAMLDGMGEKELSVVFATITALHEINSTID
ncbi:MAG: helix-turn-helix transcriptional regulator [Defluviitaleaceae bacterium]|nr:helix-turn-helix transcriptional regulator [Defluviitaleaceae bacterium]